jgi:hypothetical protein
MNMADTDTSTKFSLFPTYTITQNEYAVSDFEGSGNNAYKDIEERIERFRNALAEYVNYYDVPAQLTITIDLVSGDRSNKYSVKADASTDEAIRIDLPTTSPVEALIHAFAYAVEDCWAAQNFHFEKDGYVIEDEMLTEL